MQNSRRHFHLKNCTHEEGRSKRGKTGVDVGGDNVIRVLISNAKARLTHVVLHSQGPLEEHHVSLCTEILCDLIQEVCTVVLGMHSACSASSFAAQNERERERERLPPPTHTHLCRIRWVVKLSKLFFDFAQLRANALCASPVSTHALKSNVVCAKARVRRPKTGVCTQEHHNVVERCQQMQRRLIPMCT